MSGRYGSQFKKRENPHLPGDPAKLPDRLEMEIMGKVGTIEKQVMGTYGKSEFAGFKGKLRKGAVEIPSFFKPPRIILQERLHGLPADLSQMVHGGDGGPNKLMSVLTGFLKNGLKDLADSFPDPFLRKPVERIDRHDRSPLGRQIGIKAGGTIRTAQNPFLKIRIRKGEHLSIFRKGSPPGHDFI
jgi:hypothetical protein